MKNIAEIRRRHKINGESISSLAQEFKHSRNTIRKHLETVEEPVYQRQQQPQPKFGEFEDHLLAWLEHDAKLPRKQRRTAQPLLMPVTAVFDAYVEHTLRASSTCLASIDRNRYSVPAEWANRVVSVRLAAHHVRIVADGKVIAEHPRRFGRNQLICDPWHYLPVLEKKPGALRHGVPFRQWDLPVPIQVVRDRILKQDKGDRAFVELLLMARSLGDVGLETLEVACDLTLQTGIIATAVVLNEMRRLTEAARPKALENLALSIPTLRLEPQADCQRYDSLRELQHGQ